MTTAERRSQIVEVHAMRYALRVAECLEEMKGQEQFTRNVIGSFAFDLAQCLWHLDPEELSGIAVSAGLAEAIDSFGDAAIPLVAAIVNNESPVDSPASNSQYALALRDAPAVLAAARHAAAICDAELGDAEVLWFDVTELAIGECLDMLDDCQWLRRRMPELLPDWLEGITCDL